MITFAYTSQQQTQISKETQQAKSTQHANSKNSQQSQQTFIKGFSGNKFQANTDEIDDSPYLPEGGLGIRFKKTIFTDRDFSYI